MKRDCCPILLIIVAYISCNNFLLAASNQPVEGKITKNYVNENEKVIKIESPVAGSKPKISIKNGDYELVIDGALKIENYFEDNAYMLNDQFPDENEYFKETADLNLDFMYGREKYGYSAVEAYLGIRHKGIWGKALSFADRDSGTTIGAAVKLDETVFGVHNHYTGKAVLWFREGWLKFALNPVFGIRNRNYLQYVQFGWFPFELGRGIALGNVYGINKEFLGLYTYAGEDKSAPGIDIFGEIIKDTLWYDLYYAKFEERSKSFSDVINTMKAHYMGRKATPWRGINKDDEIIAARLKWTAVSNEKFGHLEMEPYIFCNFASDQWVEINPDTNTTLGAYGFALEHTYKDFEWGGEVAFNFGSERLRSIDRNKPTFGRDDEGRIYEYYNKIIYNNASARITEESSAAANVDFSYDLNRNGEPIPGYPLYTNADDRFRYAYKNDFRGWMAVLDAAYKWKPYDLKFAIAWGYASGDFDPHIEEVTGGKDKKYNGFVGLHENYFGKRVPSIFILDERLLKRPLSIPMIPGANKVEVKTDISFTNMQTLGAGLTWSPLCGGSRRIFINPNVVGFWATKRSHKIDYRDNNVYVSPDLARDYMGTELNLVIRGEILKDLNLFGKFAMFVPGGYFEDIKGIPLDDDFFKKLAQTVRNDFDPRMYRLGADTAYHINIGVQFKF